MHSVRTGTETKKIRWFD